MSERFFNEDWMSTFLEFEADGYTPDEDTEAEDFSMDEDNVTVATDDTAETEPENTEETPEDNPEDEEYSMDDEENQEDDNTQEEPEEDTEEDDENYEIPDEDGEGTPEGGEDEEFSMDDDTGEDASMGDNTASTEDQGTTDEKLKDLESIIFDDLSENEKKIKTRELKDLFISVYKKCDAILELITDVKRDEQTNQIVEYISNTLIDLKQYVNDYINDVFDYKTYVENLSQLQKYIMIFNAINKVFDQIKREDDE